MKIFLAGASGVVGQHLVPLLVDAGHDVVGTSTTQTGSRAVARLGARPVVMDALDRAAVKSAVAAAEPEVVIHQLTGLKGSAGNLRRFDQEFALTNRLRTEGTANLVAAAQAVGVRRFVAQSFTGWTTPRTGSGPADETEGLDHEPAPESVETLAAIADLERQVTTAEGMEGLVLRYGYLYGRGTGLSREGDIGTLVLRRRLPIVGGGAGQWSFVHIEDAARAAALAVSTGEPGVYNIVDSRPARPAEWIPVFAAAVGAPRPRKLPGWLAAPMIGHLGMLMMTAMRGSSNAKARRELGWEPVYPDWELGFRRGFD
ncbi:MAG TPA: NAD(P)-dependent oxidoreductase [Dermatophilaceae bacterium]|nr:NAD(P)-dependent oxidoreductase [Dermatophilaceae bacterium]